MTIEGTVQKLDLSAELILEIFSNKNSLANGVSFPDNTPAKIDKTKRITKTELNRTIDFVFELIFEPCFLDKNHRLTPERRKQQAVVVFIARVGIPRILRVSIFTTQSNKTKIEVIITVRARIL